MSEALGVALRASIAYATLLVLVRILGKQQIGQLTYFHYVLGLAIGNIAGTLTTDAWGKLWLHWVGLVSWAALVFASQCVSLKSRKLADHLNGGATIVVMNGQIMESALRGMRFPVADLIERLRTKDVFDLNQVEFAVVETDGSVSVLKKSQYQPITPHDVGLPTAYAGLSTQLIYDGVVLEGNLRRLGLDREWLTRELARLTIAGPQEVFLATLNTEGSLYVDAYRDRVRVGGLAGADSPSPPG